MYTDLLYEHLQTRAQSRNSIFTYTSWEDNFHDTCFSKRPRDSAVDGIYFRKHDAASYQPAVARLGRFIQTNLSDQVGPHAENALDDAQRRRVIEQDQIFLMYLPTWPYQRIG
jgi:hypothetical protein